MLLQPNPNFSNQGRYPRSHPNVYFFLQTNPPTSHLPFNTTKTFKKKKNPTRSKQEPNHYNNNIQVHRNKQFQKPNTNYDLSIQNQNHSTQLQTLKTCMTLSKEEAARGKKGGDCFCKERGEDEQTISFKTFIHPSIHPSIHPPTGH